MLPCSTGVSEYPTEEKEIEVPKKDDPKLTEKKTIKYYIARGATIKYYRVFNKN